MSTSALAKSKGKETGYHERKRDKSDGETTPFRVARQEEVEHLRGGLGKRHIKTKKRETLTGSGRRAEDGGLRFHLRR